MAAPDLLTALLSAPGPSGHEEEPTPCFVEEGPGQRGQTGVLRASSRRRGDGTQRRSTDPKQGRSRRQPRPGRRARTCGITSGPGKAAGVDETGGSGRSSEERRNSIPLQERRTRGPWWSRRTPGPGWEDQTTAKAGRPYRDEERIKLWARWGHVDLALNPSWARGQGRVDRQTPRLEAGLGKTHRPEF